MQRPTASRPSLRESITENMKGRQVAATLMKLAQEEAAALGDKAQLRFWECLADGAGHFIPTEDKDAVMTDVEAARFGKTPIDFGRHEGEQIDQVPLSYLAWLADTQRTFNKELCRYLNSKRTRRETQ